MIAAGIIAEFDPFHNGHKYLIKEARSGGATHIAVAMSGSATQRGAVSAFDKFSRAEAAVKHGADLVLELPAPLSCSNAEVFARAGIAALAGLGEGVISRLCFGSETADGNLIIQAARASSELRQSPLALEYTRRGDSYPLAMAKACEQQYGHEVASVFKSPNSTLAVEYCRAIESLAPYIEPRPVLRAGPAHNSSKLCRGFASGSQLRERAAKDEDLSAYMPEKLSGFSHAGRLDSIFLYRLLSAGRQELLELPDVNEQLADRLLKASKEGSPTCEALLMACKSKNITLARLRRLALQLVLGVRREDIIPLPYLRILAFNDRGRELLRAAKSSLPIDTSLARLESVSDRCARTIEIETKATILRSIGTEEDPCGRGCEYRKQIKIFP